MEVWDIFRDCKSGIDFENTVVKFLRCLAFEANRTGKDDGGIDIVATTSILSTKYTFYIQCKYFNTPLGKHPIQEVYAGTNYYGGNGKPVVITNNKVTVDARVYAKRLGVEIIADAEWVELKQVFKARKLINPNPHKGMLGIILASAACLCLMVPLTAFAIDTIQYNAAVDYLNSLGIPVEDLGDYSHKEIKEAVKTIDAGESSPLTEEILNLLPGNEEQIDVPTQVTSEQIRELEPAMTREEVLSLLGNTQDIGSGIYIYVYEVDGEYLLHIPFASDGAQLGVTGEDLLKALTPISGDIGSNGTIEFNGQSFSKSDLTEETLEWLEWYNSLSPEEQLAVSSIPADLYTDDGAGTLDSNAEE